jgi:BASS family bile acid:Na+ symporter
MLLMEMPQVQFSESGLKVLNFALAFLMFGVALGTEKSSFKQIVKFPKSVVVGLVSQFILMPFFTFLLVLALRPPVGFVLGMFLVAACPGGNVSNFITNLAKGNVALSIVLTGMATLLALVFTPFNFALYARLYALEGAALPDLHLNAIDLGKNIALLLVVPLLGGLAIQAKFPIFTQKCLKPIQGISMLLLAGFIGLGFWNNRIVFAAKIESIFFLVVLHNALAFAVGYFFARVSKLPLLDVKTISIETGIQNSALGLILIFNYFNGNPEMALIAALWGVWHLVGGTLLAFYWKNKA